MLFVSYMIRSAKILLLNKEGIIEKNSYERCAYESVDDAWQPILGYFSKNDEKNHAFKG